MSRLSEIEGSGLPVLDEPALILVADDDPILREYALTHLATAATRIETAQDGMAALALLKTHTFDMVLLDLEMPHVNGFEVLEAMRQDDRWRSTPVMVVTGREDVAAIDRAYGLGATAFAVKPINWRLLSYQIRYVLRAARADRALRQARARLHERYVRGAEASRELLSAAAGLLEVASQSDAATREAAKVFAERVKDLDAAAPDPGLSRSA